tara:strand:+ start:2309 stop:2752 length:444 start_codon:yes stop_codon:yes gene_type:complete
MLFSRKVGFSLKNRSLRKEFTLFILAGSTAALINIISRIILTIFLNFEISIFLSYLIGMAASFVLQRKYVFRSTKKSYKRSIAAFLLVNLVGLAQVWIVSLLIRFWLINFITSVSIVEFIAHCFGIGIPAFTSYFGHKYITFGNKVR